MPCGVGCECDGSCIKGVPYQEWLKNRASWEDLVKEVGTMLVSGMVNFPDGLYKLKALKAQKVWKLGE